MAAAATEVLSQLETMQTRILIADDQPDVIGALHMLLKAHGYATESVSSPAELLETIAHQEFDLILMDLNYARDTTSGREGLDLLEQLMALESTPPIIVMTGWATVGIAVEAMQHGVTDVVEKPWTNTKLLQSLQKQVLLGRERKELARSNVRQKQANQEVASQLHKHEQEIAEARAIQGFEISSKTTTQGHPATPKRCEAAIIVTEPCEDALKKRTTRRHERCFVSPLFILQYHP